MLVIHLPVFLPGTSCKKYWFKFFDCHNAWILFVKTEDIDRYSCMLWSFVVSLVEKDTHCTSDGLSNPWFLLSSSSRRTHSLTPEKKVHPFFSHWRLKFLYDLLLRFSNWNGPHWTRRNYLPRWLRSPLPPHIWPGSVAICYVQLIKRACDRNKSRFGLWCPSYRCACLRAPFLLMWEIGRWFVVIFFFGQASSVYSWLQLIICVVHENAIPPRTKWLRSWIQVWIH